MFKDLKKSLGHEIYFREGLPTFQLNLSDIDPKYNNIIVLDDLKSGNCRLVHGGSIAIRQSKFDV